MTEPLHDHPEQLGSKTFLGGGIAAGCVLAALLWLAIDRQSLIGDAPYHLLAGEQALRYGNNQLNLEHPPLVKLIAALPLLSDTSAASPVGVDQAIETSLERFTDPDKVRRVQRKSRILLVALFALPLLAGCFALGRRLGGPRAGSVLALSVGLSFAVLPFLPVIQTDTAVTLGFVVTALAWLSYLDAPGPTRAALVGASLGLAMAAKYSGVLLWPSTLFVLLIAGRDAHRKTRWRALRARSLDLVCMLLVASSILFLTYFVANWSYESTLGRDTIQRYLGGEGMITGQEMQRHAQLLLGIEPFAPLVSQWLTGLLGIQTQNQIGVYPSYAFGDLSSQGRWWYFPAVLLIKTPLALLLASVGALLAVCRGFSTFPTTVPQQARRGVYSVLWLTVLVYLAVAITSNYNLGVRHLMPILPLLYLPAALWAAKHRLRAATVVAVLTVEALALTPLWMSATNTWWLGALNPTRFALSGSDTDYRQNFIALEEEARSRGIENLYVLYPLLDSRELQAYVPNARLVTPGTPIQGDRWYAVSVLLEQYLPAIPKVKPGDVRGAEALASLAEAWTPLWQRVSQGEDHGYVAGTFHLFHLPSDEAGKARPRYD